jgi:hypothetical protein
MQPTVIAVSPSRCRGDVETMLQAGSRAAGRSARSPQLDGARPTLPASSIRRADMTQMIPDHRRTPRWMNVAAASLAFTLGLGVSAAALAQAMTAPQVQAKLTEQGYTKIHDVEFKDGMWHADAKSADGNDVDVRIDPATGKVYPEEEVSKLSEADVRASLSTQGYTDVHDVDFDDGVWKAKARNAAGNKVELRVDPASGKIIGTD